MRRLWVFVLVVGIAGIAIGCRDDSPKPEATLDKVVYGTVLRMDSTQGLDSLGFKEEIVQINLLEDCEVVGNFDTPPDNCHGTSTGSHEVTLSIPKDRMYGPEIRSGDYIATRWSCEKVDPSSCVFVKYADAMSAGREEGIHN